MILTEAVKTLKDVEGKLALSAVDIVPANITFQVNAGRRVDNGQITERLIAAMKRDINNATPTIFMEAGVPSNTSPRYTHLLRVNCYLLRWLFEFTKRLMTKK